MKLDFQAKLIGFFSVANLLWLAAYFWLEQSFPVNFSARRITLILSVCVILLVIGVRANKRIRAIVLDLSVSVFFVGVSLALLELTFALFPNLFPESIRNLVAVNAQEAEKRRVVEYLPFNPYAKLRPDVKVHVPGYYGPADAFVYEWITDRRGFKNASHIAALTHVPIVALGDSFTEGLGVQTADTWAARLSTEGYPTYSLGVQGYAPSQFLGAFQHYGIALRPQWVIIGYLAGDYAREAYFAELSRKGSSAPKELPSAIGRLVDADMTTKDGATLFVTKDGYEVPVVIRRRHTFCTSAIVSFAIRTFNIKLHYDAAAGVKDPTRDARFVKDSDLVKHPGSRLTRMSRYVGEFEALRILTTDKTELARNPLWISTLDALREIVSLANDNGIKVLLVIFPSRAATYHEAGTGSELPKNVSDVVESDLLQQFAGDNHISYLNLGPVFRDYMRTLTDQNPYPDYPYLKYDGHPSTKGHELIAQALADFFKQAGLSSQQSALQ